jgi:glycosyltransferase involved in cell wall biosynthesis
MPQPTISILLPVYNAAPFLSQCLESLGRQTFADYEIVAVDDGSTDDSASRLLRAASQDSRLRVYRSPHRGLIETLNDGLERCGGQYLARMDADDIAHPRRLELQVAALETPGAPDIVSSLVAHFPRQTLGEGFRIYEEWLNRLVDHDDIFRERFIESPLPHPSVMARREDLASIGGYRDMGWPEDYDLWLRLAASGKIFGKVPRTLYLWRHHENRLTRTDSRYSVERFLTCKAHHLVEGPLAGSVPVFVWGAGQTGRRLSKHLKRFGAALQAFIDIDPRKIGKTLRGLPIHPSESLPKLLSTEDHAVVLAAVSSRGARALIRQQLASLGLQEGRQFWCVA